MPNSQPPHKSTWFKREIRLDNLLILVGMLVTAIGGIALGYAKFAMLEQNEVEIIQHLNKHDDQIYQTQQAIEQLKETSMKLTTLIDERTVRIK